MKDSTSSGTCPCTPRRRDGLFVLIVLLLSLCSLAAAASADAAPPRSAALFLPLKVNTAAAPETLTAQADQALQEVLAPKGITMLPRSEAAKQINYQKSWPPAVDAVVALAAAQNANYVAAGSLTQLGETLSIDLVVLDLLGQEPPRYVFQRAESAAALSSALDRAVREVLAHTDRELLIAKIEIRGNQKTDSGAIMKQIKSQAGDVYAAGPLRDDLKNIFKMGYFDDVQLEVADTGQGREVTFVVTEKAVIGQVNLAGNKEMEEKEIKDVLSVHPNTILSTKEVQNSVENIKKLYREKGFYNTEVTAKLDYPKPERVNIQFAISEGVKVYIKEIRIAGNTAFSEKEIKKVMATSEKGLLSWITESGRLKRDILDQDRSRIGAFYHNHGYIEAQIGEPEVKREGEWLFITFNVSEGDRYRVGTIDLAGDLIEDKNDLLGQVKLGEEKFFSRQVLREDVMRLTDRYAEHGYAFAEVNPRLQKNPDLKRMDVVIDLKKGILVHVNRIVIKGNSRTRDKVIRREMQIKEGGIFDATAMRKSTEKLQRLEYFEEVNINPEPTVQDDLMDVIVDVKEKPTGTFSVGAGYSSVDHLSFMGEVSQNNFMGKGQRVSLAANLSSASTRFNLSFTEPRLDDSKLLFGFDAYNWMREYDDYTKDSNGGALRFGYPIWEKWHLFWAYGFDDTQLSDLKPTAAQVILDSANINTTSYVRLGAVRDTRNRPSDPSKGEVHNIAVKHAGGVLGGDSAFTKWEASTNWYFPWTGVPYLKEINRPWFNDTVLRLKGAIGYAVENEEGKLPVYEKFYLGGLNTVRGFDSSKISPLDPVTGERIGGEKMWYMNAEWIFSIAQEIGLKGVAFFDAGNVYTDSETWDVGDLKKAVGVGFRWLSPMGPLRLEWGYNIDPAPGEDQGVWDFSIGGGF
ncbi:MAG: outer membrane protein assembly factor BamA [Thermodesulfobacteriota bacterium]